MTALTNLTTIQKVYAYVIREIKHQSQLLIFNHVDFPEAGIQVPGGTVEPGESITHAALREALEETSLDGLVLKGALGSVRRDMRGFGIEAVHHRHYFYFSCPSEVKERWVAYEETPSDGSEGPIAFGFYWVDLDDVPPLLGGLDERLPVLKSLMAVERN